mgnify:CR=1 FL=1
MLRFLLPLGIFALLVGFLAVGLNLDPREVPSPLVGKPAPAFAGQRLDDPETLLTAGDLREDVSLFNVWASWCVSCRQEHPLLVELARDDVVPIYGLNYKDERRDALRWLASLGNPYRASVHDPDGRIGLDWGVYGVPETFVVDRAGIVRHKHTGPLTVEVWEQELQPLIARLRAEAG